MRRTLCYNSLLQDFAVTICSYYNLQLQNVAQGLLQDSLYEEDYFSRTEG